MSAKESLWHKFKRKGLSVHTFDEVLDTSGGTMKRVLHWSQLMLLGIGTMVGAGVFVTTGSVANSDSGPAVAIAYIVAGFACTLSALCYAEFACDFPVAGGAFNYITVTFGEFAGWMTACQLFVEWTLANAAVAKGFSSYLAALFDIPDKVFVLYSNSYLQIEWLSVVLLLLLTCVMLMGTKESALAQNISVSIYLVIIAFIIICGGTKVDNSNYKPYLPLGGKGVFAGASTVFFSFIGFDMVASMSEEAQNPKRDLPIAICGSLGVATAIYVAMSTVVVGMVNWKDEGLGSAGFAYAFEAVGLKWASKVVAVGAVIGCINSEFGGLLGQSRIFVTMGRAGLLPSGLAKIHPRMGIPHWSCLTSGIVAAILAFLLNINLLLDFVSLGTLFAYMFVCTGVLWRHYYVPGGEVKGWPIVVRILLILAAGLICGCVYGYDQPLPVMWTFLAVYGVLVFSFLLLKDKYTTDAFRTPLVPFVPTAGMFINMFLIGMLKREAWFFWLSFVAITCAIYFLYGIHHTQGEGAKLDAAAIAAEVRRKNEAGEKLSAEEIAIEMERVSVVEHTAGPSQGLGGNFGKRSIKYDKQSHAAD